MNKIDQEPNRQLHSETLEILEAYKSKDPGATHYAQATIINEKTDLIIRKDSYGRVRTTEVTIK